MHEDEKDVTYHSESCGVVCVYVCKFTRCKMTIIITLIYYYVSYLGGRNLGNISK